jgi:dCMP deaminase
MIDYLRIAEIVALASKSQKLQVGAVLVKEGRIISTGYNGTCTGMDNVCEAGEELKTLPEVVHAEANVICFAAKYGVATDGCVMYTTTSPCFECCKLIIQSGIKKVYYRTPYRDFQGPMTLLSSAGIRCIRL